MKCVAHLLFYCLSFAFVMAAAPHVRAQSQGEMNMESAHDFVVADAKLNEAYKQLSAKLDNEALEKLRVAQRAWIAFRDAQAEFEGDLNARGGTMAPLVRNVCRTELTEARTAQLEKMLLRPGN